jgi:hypothetical protein
MRAGWTSLGNRQYAGHGQSNQSDPEQRHAAFTASALSCDEGRQVESKGQDVEKKHVGVDTHDSPAADSVDSGEPSDV